MPLTSPDSRLVGRLSIRFTSAHSICLSGYCSTFLVRTLVCSLREPGTFWRTVRPSRRDFSKMIRWRHERSLTSHRRQKRHSGSHDNHARRLLGMNRFHSDIEADRFDLPQTEKCFPQSLTWSFSRLSPFIMIRSITSGVLATMAWLRYGGMCANAPCFTARLSAPRVSSASPWRK
jgi:hypothetical protein